MAPQRYSYSHHSSPLQRLFRRLAPGEWLAIRMARLRKTRKKWLSALQSLLTPNWLQRTHRSVRMSLQKAEKRVAQASRSVSQTITESTVASGARTVARRSRVFESRFVTGLSRTLLGLANLLFPEPLRRLFGFLGKRLWNAFRTGIVFVSCWLGTRHYWHLVLGIPAFLLALPLAYCMIRLPFYSNITKAKLYRVAVQGALQEKDYDTADLYLRKLHQLGAMTEAVEYQAACKTHESGDLAEAVAQMCKLAPKGEPGFPPAHVWLARHYLSGNSEQSQAETDQLAEKHLRFALDREPGNPEARALLAMHFERSGRLDDALSELREVVKHLPEQGLTLAQLYARQGRWDAAQREVQKVLSLYDRKESQGTKLDRVEFEIWATALQIMNDTEKAEQILERALVEYPDNEQLAERLAALCVVKASSLQAQQIEPQEQLRLLTRACELCPQDEDALIRLGELLHREETSGNHSDIPLQELFPSDNVPPRLHAVLGTQAAQRGDFATAAQHLSAACEHNPQDAQSLNNLAWVYLKIGKKKYDEAMALVNRAIDIQPDEPMYRETRGQILLRMGQYEEAVQDLEYALNGLQESTEIHLLLAEAYEQLGQTERAEAHRQTAGRSGSG